MQFFEVYKNVQKWSPSVCKQIGRLLRCPDKPSVIKCSNGRELGKGRRLLSSQSLLTTQSQLRPQAQYSESPLTQSASILLNNRVCTHPAASYSSQTVQKWDLKGEWPLTHHCELKRREIQWELNDQSFGNLELSKQIKNLKETFKSEKKKNLRESSNRIINQGHGGGCWD